MLIRRADASQPLPSEITPESVYRERRRWLQQCGLAGLGLALPGTSFPAEQGVAPYSSAPERSDVPAFLAQALKQRQRATQVFSESVTPYAVASGYNNFYEFGMNKSDPAEYARGFRVEPWRVRVDGECAAPADYTLEDLLKPHALQDRIYRFRCVEAWSMVIPWVGFPLADLIKRMRPTSKARYVEFTTLHDPERMPGQRQDSLDWPYVEGLRMDEAMHPLALLAVGMHGRSLPPQNGAPFRLIVPWKYGFKSIKSIVRIRFSEQQPRTTWNQMASDEYGFYANVNPAVEHPRWSQARERRLPTSLFSPNWRPTLPFNGYARDVAGLYRRMDLRRYY